jgi:hypothetical protein
MVDGRNPYQSAVIAFRTLCEVGLLRAVGVMTAIAHKHPADLQQSVMNGW